MLDNFWTWNDCGQSLNFNLFAPKSSESEFFCGQRLDNLWTRTDCGQSLDFNLFALKTSESEIFLWTEIGQPLYVDRPWTMFRYLLSCLRNPKSQLDNFGLGKTLVKVSNSAYFDISQSDPCINYLLIQL